MFGRPNPDQQRARRAAEKAANLTALVSRPATRRSTFAGTTTAGAVEKDKPLRSEAYRRLVAALPCWMCHIEGHSQAAHADKGKGLSLKADDRTCFPACGPHDGLVGCHYTIGSTGTLTRDERRALEEQASQETRAAILAAGTWPATLPAWPADQLETT